MEITPDMITQFGLMNKISTGNSVVDILLCMLVPIVIKQFLPKLHQWLQSLYVPKSKEKQVFTRAIEYTQRSSYCWWEENDLPSNAILQRALLNYINTYGATLRALPDADLQLKKRPWTKNAEGADGQAASSSAAGSGDDDEVQQSNEHNYDVNVAPPIGAWVELKGGKIRFMRKQESLDDKNKAVKSTYLLESSEKDGNEAIEAFVQEALALYRKQQSAKVDPSRYMYMPVLSSFRGLRTTSGDDDKSSSAVQYKRYKLSEEKTFSSFFHPDKEAIVSLVDSFQNKTGKFAVAGYPNKLGFLLYGPPGTGKTSFIKALAQYTKRSIINIPLSKISTNQELIDIMFDQRITVENDSDGSVSLPFSKTIFVMEDVDAASNVVHRRTGGAAAAVGAASASSLAALAAAEAQHAALLAQAQAEAAQAQAAASARKGKGGKGGRRGSNGANSRDGEEHDQDPSDSDNDDDDKNNNNDGDNDNNGKDGDAASDSGRNGSGSGRGRSGGGANDYTFVGRDVGASSSPMCVSSGVGGGVAFGPSLPAAFGRGSLFKGDDELNLAGLLNVLDGVVDTPNRIIIMTSNHPDKLDPALIRPGRINKKVYMGRMLIGEALRMVKHYFGPIAPADEAALRAVWVEDVLSPASLEAACAEHDTVPQLVQALAAMIAEQGRGETFKPC